MVGNGSANWGGRESARPLACPRLRPAPMPLLTSRRIVDFGLLCSAGCR
ncbi:hypothetical protein AB0O91_07950 [Kitasatospora sp. NPDC089797]